MTWDGGRRDGGEDDEDDMAAASKSVYAVGIAGKEKEQEVGGNLLHQRFLFDGVPFKQFDYLIAYFKSLTFFY